VVRRDGGAERVGRVSRRRQPKRREPLTNAQRRLVADHVGVAAKAARAVMKRGLPAHVDYEDMRSGATEGLCHAAASWNGQGDFAGWALYRAYGGALDELRRMDVLPRTVRREVALLEQRAERREPLEPEAAALLARAQAPLSLQLPADRGTAAVEAGPGAEGTIADKVADRHRFEDAVADRDELRRKLAAMKPPERETCVVSELISSGLARASRAGTRERPTRARTPSDLPGLSEAERQLLEHLSNGGTVVSFARRRGTAESTARSQARTAYRKLGARNSTAAVARAMRDGLIA
jgi:RNA polymerase sigma factor (sigma-70 family)